MNIRDFIKGKQGIYLSTKMNADVVWERVLKSLDEIIINAPVYGGVDVIFFDDRMCKITIQIPMSPTTGWLSKALIKKISECDDDILMRLKPLGCIMGAPNIDLEFNRIVISVDMLIDRY